MRGDRKEETEQWCQTKEHWSSDGYCPLTIRAFEGEGEEALHIGSARARTSESQPPLQRQMTELVHFYIQSRGPNSHIFSIQCCMHSQH